MNNSLVFGRHINCKLQNVLYVPDLTYNLLSVGAVDASGHLVVFDGKTCRIEKDTSVTEEGQLHNGLYCLNTISTGSFDSADAALVTDMNVWHQLLSCTC